jgi:hypothetical protein
MPNYIKALESEKRLSKFKEDEVNDRIRAFQKFLCTSDKFKGFNPDGSPKDLINIKDVLAYIEGIKEPLAWQSWDDCNLAIMEA